MNENEVRAALEAVRKDAADPTLAVGDTVFCRGMYATVTEILRHGPGAHALSPVRNDWNAVQVITDNGSRWHGERPGPECYGTIWVCQCCALLHANGECCTNEQHGGDGQQPLSAIEAPFTLAMGMASEEHSCGRENGEDVPECDCERDTYTTWQCEGCGSYLHGERHAMTLFREP